MRIALIAPNEWLQKLGGKLRDLGHEVVYDGKHRSVDLACALSFSVRKKVAWYYEQGIPVAEYVLDVPAHRFFDDRWRDRYRRYRDQLRSAATVLCLSDATARDVWLHYGVLAKTCFPYIDVDRLRDVDGRDTDPSRPRQILQISRFVPYKNFEDTIDAVAALNDVELVFCGMGKAASLQERARQRGVSLRIHENASDDLLARELRRSTVLVSPSSFEGFGLTPAEALHCGTPVVLSDIPVFREVYGDVARFHRHKDIPSLTEALRDALGDPEVRRCQMKRARPLLDSLTLDAFADRFESALTEAGSIPVALAHHSDEQGDPAASPEDRPELGEVIPATPTLDRDHSETSPRVGILSTPRRDKGLWRDTESILWAIGRKRIRVEERPAARVSVFPVPSMSPRHWRTPASVQSVAGPEGCDELLPVGTSFGDWLKSLDVLVHSETLLLPAMDHAHQKGVRVVYRPNLDWALYQRRPERWVDELKRRPWVEIWSQTERIHERLRGLGLKPQYVPWSIPDPVTRDRNASASDPVQLVMIAGAGGWHGRRGVDIVLRAFRAAREVVPSLRLLLKIHRRLHRMVPEELCGLPGVEVVDRFLSRLELDEVFDRADAMLHVSRWEGFGLPLLEALHRGIPVLATDGWPMNELVEHEHNGLLVPAARKGDMRLAPRWEVDPDALSKAMVLVATDSDLRARLTCPQPSSLVARQRYFALRVRERLLGESPPKIILLTPPNKASDRRSEEFWKDALVEFGYSVEQIPWNLAATDLVGCLRQPHEFVLTSKAPIGTLETVRSHSTAPLVVWHHDLVAHRANRQRWFRKAAQLADLACIPEDGPRYGGRRVRCLLPGPRTHGDRGPGQRPRHLSEPDSGDQVVFIGNAARRDPRVSILSAVQEGLPLRIYGMRDTWRKFGKLPCSGPAYEEKADEIHRRASVVISVSRSHEIASYTSIRLFNAAAVGGCIAVQDFPGLDSLYPNGCLAKFDGPAHAVETIRSLLQDKDRREEMRSQVIEQTWRHHTWQDRVATLLSWVASLSATEDRFPTVATPSKESLGVSP